MYSEIFFWGFSSLYLLFLIIFGVSLLFSLFTQIPYVPSRRHVAQKIIKLANIKNGQTVIDLGCGDLRLLIRASKNKKIKAIGYEISPLPFLLGKLNKLINKSTAEIKYKNMFKADLTNADVIFIYLIPEILNKIGTKINEECKNGTLVISHTFKIPNLPIIKEIPKEKNYPKIYIYQISK